MQKAAHRTRVEHPFPRIQCLFGFRKAPGALWAWDLRKNILRCHVLCALTNLYQVVVGCRPWRKAAPGAAPRHASLGLSVPPSLAGSAMRLKRDHLHFLCSREARQLRKNAWQSGTMSSAYPTALYPRCALRSAYPVYPVQAAREQCPPCPRPRPREFLYDSGDKHRFCATLRQASALCGSGSWVDGRGPTGGWTTRHGSTASRVWADSVPAAFP